MRKLKLIFYDDELTIDLPLNFEILKKEISDLFKLEALDVEELLFFFKEDKSDRININNEKDYHSFVLSMEDDLEIFIEVSENSRLYQNEFSYTKISAEEVAEDETKPTLVKKEAIKKDIMEKERILQALIDKEQKEKARRAERERIQKEKIDLILLKEKLEKEKIEKEKLKDSLAMTVSEIVNNNIEKVRQELISKTILETTAALDTAFKNSLSTEEIKNVRSSYIFTNRENRILSIHKGIKCDGCGVYPIQGVRYKCTTCFDFDYCADCEDRNAESHSHPFIKIRHSVTTDNKLQGEEEDSNYLNIDSNRANSVSSMFDRWKNKLREFMKILGCKRKKFRDVIAFNKKIVFDDMANKDMTFSYKGKCSDYADLVEEMKKSFFLPGISDEQIFSVLEETKGNLEDTLEKLINLK